MSCKQLQAIAYDAVTRVDIGTGMPQKQFNATLRRKVNLQNIMGLFKLIYGTVLTLTFKINFSVR
jgi:hypothetical protein